MSSYLIHLENNTESKTYEKCIEYIKNIGYPLDSKTYLISSDKSIDDMYKEFSNITKNKTPFLLSIINTPKYQNISTNLKQWVNSNVDKDNSKKPTISVL